MNNFEKNDALITKMFVDTQCQTDFERKLEVHHIRASGCLTADAGGSAHGERVHFTALVLGCIDASDRESRLLFKQSWIADHKPVLQSRNQFGNPFFEDRHALFKPVIGERIYWERGG
jgi:hypothetical protein